MYQLHDFSVYHPNSYIASRRSSLPRQGYGGVYERSPSSPWPAARHRELKGFPRHLSEYSIWAAPPSPQPTSGLRSSTTGTDLCVAAATETEVCSAAEPRNEEPAEPEKKEEEKHEQEDEEVESPPPQPAEVRIAQRLRGAEERRLLEAVRKGRRARGEGRLPSDLLQGMSGELLAMPLEPEDAEDEQSETQDCSPEDWRSLVLDLVTTKEAVKSSLDRNYREAKRQVTQFRQHFEKLPNNVVSRFDRLVADITCFSRLSCQLARQSTRLEREDPTRGVEILMDEQRRSLKKQLAELPRLRDSLLARQSSLNAQLQAPLRENFALRLHDFWSLAAHIALLEAEMMLDSELAS